MKRIKAWIKRFIINTVREDMKANGELRHDIMLTISSGDSQVVRIVK